MVQKLIALFILLHISICNHAQIDYSHLNNWASHPNKIDLGDKVPKPLQANYVVDTSVDVFFIHPTTYTDVKKIFGNNAEVTDESLNQKTDETTIQYQASIFNSYNLYAPRYNQAHISSYFPSNNEEYIQAKKALDTAYSNIKKSFEYYLKHWNNGKPIIIASHSQGTTHAKQLMKDFFDGKPLQEKLVAAFLVGMPVEKNWFGSIKPCNKPNETQCFCSWRTLKEEFKENYMLQEPDSSIVVTNPITFDIDKPLASRKENLGSILRNFDKLISNVVGAKVVNNVLWTEKPRFFGNIFLTTKNYHIADYNFYYVNIRNNTKQRVEAFKESNR